MKKLLIALTAFGMILGCSSATAIERYQSGTHYLSVVPAQTTTAKKGKVEVIEFFWYGCPHCYQFEPTLHKWIENKPENVVFKRIPAIFRAGWDVHAKAYYAAEALGITDKVHQAIFDEIHKSKKALDKPETIAAFMASKSGVEKQVILDTMLSFSIEAKARKAQQAARQYGLRGVPAIAVAGKYMTSATQTGSNQGMIDVTNFLISKEANK